MTKHILTLSIALAGACTLTLSAIGQDAKPPGGSGGPGKGHGGPGEHRPPPSPEERLKHMKETLNLTDDQAAKILPILQKSQEAMKAIHEDQSMKPEEKHAKAQETMKAGMQEVGAILTPEQQDKWKAEMEKRRAGRGPGGPAGPGPDAAK